MSGTFRIVEETAMDPGCREAYAAVPIAFRVESRLVVTPVREGLGGLLLTEEPVSPAYIKDYDAYEGEGPAHWAETFDLTNWGMLAAFDGARRVGGAALAWNSPEVHMLEGRRDVAALWDVRVHPDFRGRGVGHRLFAAAVDWAKGRGCREMVIETQNVNVPACRFYARQGCVLTTIRQHAYPTLPDEVQLIWRREP